MRYRSTRHVGAIQPFVVTEPNGRLSYTGTGVLTLILTGAGAGALAMHLFMGKKKR
jgi:hypothetical protein